MTIKKVIAIVALSIGLVILLDSAAESSGSYVVENGSQESSLCLDSDINTDEQNGGVVHIWDCVESSTIWWLRGDGSIQNGSGMCLDSDVNTWERNGGLVHIWECNGTPQQKWTLSSSSHQDGYGNNGSFVQNSQGLCLDSDWHTMHESGGIVHIWECLGNRQQTWFFTPLLE